MAVMGKTCRRWRWWREYRRAYVRLHDLEWDTRYGSVPSRECLAGLRALARAEADLLVS